MAFAFAILTGLGMLLGVWTIHRSERWAVQHTGELIAFASGLLVSGALLHLLARSIELTGVTAALSWTLVSFLVLYLVEAHFVPHVHGRGDAPIEGSETRRSHIGWMVVTGLAIHSIVDGIAVGAGLSASTFIGWVALVIVFVHKMPVGIASISALYHAGTETRRALWIATALACVTPVAVVISYFALRGISAGGLGLLLALAAGSFLYVGAADLLPEGQARGRISNTFLFLLGVLIMVGLRLSTAGTV